MCAYSVLPLLLCTLLLAQASAQIPAPAALSRTERPELRSRVPEACYLQDALDKHERIWLRTQAELALYRSARAEGFMGSIGQGAVVELLAFTEHGVLVRGILLQSADAAIGWLDRKQVTGASAELFAALKQAEERRSIVNEYIEHGILAIGMSVAEAIEAKGEAQEQELMQTRDEMGSELEGRLSWVRTRRVPRYQLQRDPFTGYVYRRKIGYDLIERSRTEVEIENGVLVSIRSNEPKINEHLALSVPEPIDLHALLKSQQQEEQKAKQ